MFERFIFATDFSPAAFAVIKNLGELKDYGAKECLIMQCFPLEQVGSIAVLYTNSVFESNLKNQREILENQGFIVETRIVHGLPKKEICRISEEEHYSTIVVGAEKHSLTSEPFLGDLAYDVIHQCRKPILIIRLEKGKREGMELVSAKAMHFREHILFPTDFSETAGLAFESVKELVATGIKKVTLMHVQDQTRIDPHLSDRLEEFNQIDRTRLDAMKKELQELAPVEVEIELGYGKPSTKIIRQIRERNVQLVIMGSQGRGYVKEVFLGSVSQHVARHSDASVLLIPASK